MMQRVAEPTMTSKTDDTTQGQHTKGPWMVTHQVNTDYGWDVVANGETIAQCGYTRDTFHAYAANAHLIAAAPDLLAALELVVEQLSTTDTGNNAAVDAAYHAARAALAKAGAK